MNIMIPPSERQIARMRANVLRAAVVHRRRDRKRRFIVAISAFSVLAVATTGGAVAIRIASAHEQETSFDCYTTDDLNLAHGTTTYVDEARDSNHLLSLHDRVTEALQTCVAGYRAEPTDPSGPAAVQVPNPTACILGDERIAVLPNARKLDSTQFCSRLGLNAPDE